MSNLEPATPAAGSLTLQDVVEQLSDVVDRPVSLSTRDRTVTVTSAPRTPHLHIVGDPDRDAEEPRAVVVDVRDASSLVGHLSIVSPPGVPPLTPAQYEAVDSAVSLAASLLGTTSAWSDRESIMRTLLSTNPEQRRDSYSTALHRRWLQRGQGTVLRALMVDTAASRVECQAFGRFLSTLRPVPLWLAGERPGFLFAVGPHVDPSVDRAIIDEGNRRGIRVLGIGTATPARSAADLEMAAAHAVSAAELSASLEEFQPSVDISRVGGWALLGAVAGDPSWLKVISPAAEALVSHGDQVQRRTIETLLDVGGQVSAACELLFVHRTTLYYRLEKMPDVVRDAMADGMKRSTLHLALKLVRLWEASGRI